MSGKLGPVGHTVAPLLAPTQISSSVRQQLLQLLEQLARWLHHLRTQSLQQTAAGSSSKHSMVLHLKLDSIWTQMESNKGIPQVGLHHNVVYCDGWENKLSFGSHLLQSHGPGDLFLVNFFIDPMLGSLRACKRPRGSTGPMSTSATVKLCVRIATSSSHSSSPPAPTCSRSASEDMPC